MNICKTLLSSLIALQLFSSGAIEAALPPIVFTQAECDLVLRERETTFVFVPKWAAQAILQANECLLSQEWKALSQELCSTLHAGKRVLPKNIVQPIVSAAYTDLQTLGTLLPRPNQFETLCTPLKRYQEAIQTGAAQIVIIPGPANPTLSCQLS